MPGAGFYLSALHTLSSDRPVSVGFGAVVTGQIPFVSLVAFAKTYGIVDLIEFDAFAQIMRKLDAAEVKRINETKPPPTKTT